jgi:hypothetical protein
MATGEKILLEVNNNLQKFKVGNFLFYSEKMKI